METPKNESSPGNLCKKTPYTPCRRVGLSRSTPKSIKNVPKSGDSETKFENKLQSTGFNITPALCEEPTVKSVDQEKFGTVPNTACAYITPKREGRPTLYRGIYKRRRLQNSEDKLKTKDDINIYKVVLDSDDNVSPVRTPASKTSNFGIPCVEHTVTPNFSKTFEEESLSDNCDLSLNNDSDEDIKCEPTEEELIEIKEKINKKKESLRELQEKLKEREKRQEKLKNVTKMWLTAGQEAIQELLTCYNNSGYSMSMSQLLDNLHIPYSLLHWNPQDEEFQ